MKKPATLDPTHDLNFLTIYFWRVDILTKTRMTTSVSSEALSNYIKDILKMKVKKNQQKNKKINETFQLLKKSLHLCLCSFRQTDKIFTD